MMGYPPVSIYIVTYLTSEERGQVLLHTCEHALAQRYPNIEVVVSDNGGSYTAQDALKSITDPRLKVYLGETNEGFTGNINRCVKLCSHEIIKPLCDDDLIHADFLIHTVPLLNENTLVVVDVEKYRLGADPQNIKTGFESPLPHEERAPGYRRSLWSIPYSSSSIPSATLFAKKLFVRLGGYDPRTITSDWDFFVEACLHARVVHVGRVLCYVGVWGGSLTEEMLEEPFFYPTELQYSKFRVLRCKKLRYGERAALLSLLLREFGWQSLRPIKNWRQKAYHSGYRTYARCFFKLWFQRLEQFGSRPSQGNESEDERP